MLRYTLRRVKCPKDALSSRGSAWIRRLGTLIGVADARSTATVAAALPVTCTDGRQVRKVRQRHIGRHRHMEGWGAAHKSRASTTAAAPTAFDAAALQRARDAGRWLVAIRGAVYDVTAFLDEHPGGRDAIENEGADATAAWEAIGHSRAARRKMRSMRVGTFVGGNGYSVETGEAPDEAHAAAEDHFGSDVPPSSEDLPFPGPPPSPHGGGQYGVLLAHTMSTHTLAQAWAEQYGRLVSFRVGDKAFLQVSDPDVAAQIWTANPPKEGALGRTAKRGEGTSLVDDLATVFGTGVLTIDHDRWPERRALLRPAFTVRRIRDTFPLVETHALRLRDDIEAANTAATAAGDSRPGSRAAAARLDARELTTDVAFAIIVHAALGDAAAIFSESELSELRSAFEDAFLLTFKRDTRNAAFSRAVETMRRFSQRAAHRLRELGADADADADAASVTSDPVLADADGSSASRCPVHHLSGTRLQGLDIMQRMVAAFDAGAATEEDLRGELVTTMFAGHETSSNTVAWLLWELSCRPHVQARVQRELDEMFDRIEAEGGREIVYEDLLRLRYLTRVIKEGMRLHTVVPLTTRELESDVVVHGRTVRAGTTVIFSAWAMHHDAGLWPGVPPDVFEPDRQWNARAFKPFTIGPRDCIGRNFALLELRAVLAVLLRSFDVHPADNMPPRAVSMGTIQPDHVYVRFHARAGGQRWEIGER